MDVSVVLASVAGNGFVPVCNADIVSPGTRSLHPAGTPGEAGTADALGVGRARRAYAEGRARFVRQPRDVVEYAQTLLMLMREVEKWLRAGYVVRQPVPFRLRFTERG